MDKDTFEDLIGNQQMTAHRYGSFVQNRINALLKRVDDRVTLQIYDLLEDLSPTDQKLLLAGNYKTQRLIKLRESLRELQKEIISITSSVIGDEGKAYAGYELDRIAKVAQGLGIEAASTAITSSQAYAAAMARPMLGRHIRDHIKDMSRVHIREITSAINEGYLLSESTPNIMARIRGTVTAKRTDGLLYKRNGKIERIIVRNALTHISSVAAIESFKAAQVAEYYLSPVLDGRTSVICGGLNSGGVKYYKVGSGLMPPLHPGGCRTIPLPRGRDNAEIPKPFINDKRPLGKIPKEERAGKIGKTTAKSYEAHLKRQGAAWQLEWLGESRYKLWKAGMPLGKFSDPRKGVVYNLAELRARDATFFEAAGL